MPAETAHYFSLNSFKFICKIPFAKNIITAIFRVKNEYDFLGLKFYNRVGLAAGFDKNAKYLEELKALGFGFIEIGTVTPIAQAGNPKPRLFRLKQDECIINRMGFNNDGLQTIIDRLKNRPSDLIVGGNIGKNKDTPNENAKDDYLKCFVGLYNYVDYFVVNVSSPNTPNLRSLQEKKPLSEILLELINQRSLFIKNGIVQKPILLKIAPDLTLTQLDDVVEIIENTGIDGIVVSNTTISRDNLKSSKQLIEQIGNGGLSGPVLTEKSNQMIDYILAKSNGKIPVIGVGGINNENTAKAKFKAGASLIQVYTGFIYQGPSFIKKIASIK